MTEEVGKDLGSKLGKYIDSDRCSWLSEQAKFMRIRVDIPIDKPLRRGGNVVNSDGDKFWVTFKYERLPNFCFLCGILGHDKKHCSGFQGKAEGHRQYGDWLRASNGFKGGFEKQKATTSSGHEERTERMDEDSRNPIFPMNTNPMSLGTKQAGFSSGQSNHTSSQSAEQGQGNTLDALSAENQRSDNAVSPLSPAPSLDKLSRDSQLPAEAGEETEATPSVLGSHMHTLERLISPPAQRIPLTIPPTQISPLTLL